MLTSFSQLLQHTQEQCHKIQVSHVSQVTHILRCTVVTTILATPSVSEALCTGSHHCCILAVTIVVY